MARRYPSPTDDDIERIAESINNLDIKQEIRDMNSFVNAYRDFFEGVEQMQDNERVQKKVFHELEELKGYPLLEDRDFSPKAEKQRLQRVKKETYNIPSLSKGRVVFSRETEVTIGKSTFKRLRDNRGRFTKRRL